MSRVEVRRRRSGDRAAPRGAPEPARHPLHVGRVAPGSGDAAIRVAMCESHLDDEALNRSSGASGLFQHLRRYWPGRARALPDRLFPRRPGPFSSQANAWAAAMMVRRDGWGAWSCA